LLLRSIVELMHDSARSYTDYDPLKPVGKV
jgi:hypothetical protein